MTKNGDQAEAERSRLGGDLVGFGCWMEARGYVRRTVEQYCAIAGRLDRHLTARNIDVACLDEGHIEDYLKQVEPRRSNGRKALVVEYCRHACRRLLEYLREEGATVRPIQNARGPAILRDYLSFLSHHRALDVQTITGHERWLLRLLEYLGLLEAEAGELRELSLSGIDGFLIETTQGLKRSSIGHGCAAIRGFLRYLYMRGIILRDLGQHVVTPRIYSLEGLPRAIDWADVERTLAAVDRSGPSGRRDYAILALLAYCGLRAGEVAALCVDDLDWRHDTIRVRRGKCDTIEAIPLIPAVGGALVEYLQCRPVSLHREVFLKLIAPAGSMSRAGVGWVARKYLLAAGVKATHFGAHTLRHSYAVQLLRKGFPLKVISDALGHRNPQSTFIYTKAPTEDLHSVALEISEVIE